MLKISIVIPAYNVEKYIEKCIFSCINQNIKKEEYEIIIINDGSTDKSLSICEKYVKRYPYFRLIDQDNKGLSIARNIGIEYATGEYIMFLDSDDYLRTDAVKLLKSHLFKERQDAIYFNAEIICESGCIVEKNNYERELSILDHEPMKGLTFFKMCYPENYIVSVCMAVYNKMFINEINLKFPEGLFYEDNYFTFMFISQAKQVIYLSEKLYQRRYRGDSITMSRYTEKKFSDYIKIVLLMWQGITCKAFFRSFEWKELLLRLISDHCSLVLSNYKLCMDQSIALGIESLSCLNDMSEKYIRILKNSCLEKKIRDVTLLNRIIRNLKTIILYEFGNKYDNQDTLYKLNQKQKECYRNILNRLPLRKDNYKVGIYGTGMHTEGMLGAFETLIGKIKCDLVFIDSYKEKGIYKGKRVINYQQIDDRFDMIIISSFVHQKSMVNCVKSVNKEIQIYTFYDELNEDIFSEKICFDHRK